MDKWLEKMIQTLMQTRGLGQIIKSIESVSGGYMHRMYKVQTENGTYAVKHLNQEIMSREGVFSNFSRAEEIESILEKEGIPVAAALCLEGSKMQNVDGQFFYIFNWQEGHITDWNHISCEQCSKAGNILGRIHAIKSEINSHEEPVNSHIELIDSDAGSFNSDVEPEMSKIDWHDYILQAKKMESEIAPYLEEQEELLVYAQDEMNKARVKLPDLLTLSDEDMDPKNVMWNEGNPIVIDLECLDRGNPASHVLQLSLQWSGITTCDLDLDKIIAYFDGYLQAYDNGFRAYEEIFGVAYTWVEWLDYNIQRSLGKCVDETERQMGISQVKSTIQRISYLRSREDEIKQTLNNYLVERDRCNK